MRAEGTAGEVFAAFLRLGCICFGGPIAHIGYFRAEFVAGRRWVDEARFSEIVALCQFLPGPASSQVGFAIGLRRAGWVGALAAWVGFTLPTAVMLVGLGYGLGGMVHTPWGAGVLHGLNLVAVAVIAEAVWGMARRLCPDRSRASIAACAAVLAAAGLGALGQILGIALGAVAGLAACRGAVVAVAAERLAPLVSRRAGALCLGAFVALLLLGPALPGASG